MCVALSTSEAEYIAMSESCSGAKWIRTCPAELGLEFNSPLSIYCDNSVANSWAENSNIMRREKQIDLKYHSIKEFFKNGITIPEDIKLNDNPADGFTKPLQKIKFEIFRDEIGVKPWAKKWI